MSYSYSSLLGRVTLSIIQIAILTRILSVEDFGYLALIGLFTSTVLIVFDCGTIKAYIAQGEHNKNYLYLMFAFCFTVIAFIILSTITILNFFYDTASFPSNIKVILILSTLQIFLSATVLLMSVIHEKNLSFKVLTRIELFSAVVTFACTVYFAKNELGITSVLLGSCFGALCSIFLLIMYWPPQEKKTLATASDFIFLLRSGGWIALVNLCNKIFGNIDIIIGTRMLGIGDLGLYTVPKNIFNRAFFTVVPALNRVLLPVLSKYRDSDPIKKYSLYFLDIYLIVCLPLFSVLIIYAEFLILLILGVQWVNEVNLIRLLAISFFLKLTVSLLNPIFIAAQKSNLLFQWSLGYGLLSLALLIAAVPIYGVLGLAICAVVVSSLQLIHFWFYVMPRIFDNSRVALLLVLLKHCFSPSLCVTLVAVLKMSEISAGYVSLALVLHCTYHGLVSRKTFNTFAHLISRKV